MIGETHRGGVGPLGGGEICRAVEKGLKAIQIFCRCHLVLVVVSIIKAGVLEPLSAVAIMGQVLTVCWQPAEFLYWSSNRYIKLPL